MNAPSLPPRLDFDALSASYSSSLVTKLRGHGAEAEGLELWVPDEDPLTSLRYMLDAAATVGREEICIWISTKSAVHMEVDDVRNVASSFGRADVSVLADGSLAVDVFEMKTAGKMLGALHAKLASGARRRSREVSVAIDADVAERAGIPRIRTVAASYGNPTLSGTPGGAKIIVSVAGLHPALPPCYLERVSDAASRALHRGPAFEGGVTGEMDGRVLSLELDGDTILRAAFTGAKDDVESGVLETLCASIEGLPIDEAADHGAIRAEARLRDQSQRPVSGIVTPRAAGEVFAMAEKLMRKARASHGTPRARNEHDNAPNESWRSAKESVRRDMLAGAIETFCRSRSVNASDVEVTAIEWDVRVVVTLPDSLPANEKPKFAMDLERAIRRDVDERLELYAEEVKDKNKLRRLAVVATGER